MRKLKDVDLSKSNTFGIRAKAKEYIEFNSKEEAKHYFQSENSDEKNILILGGGSNILLTGDYSGLILKNEIRGIETLYEDKEKVCLKVGAGENWHEFVLYCVNSGYAGIENLSLIPGSVGASPIQNIGAYGTEVKEVITKVESIEIKEGKEVIFNNEDCKFAYRSSIFKTDQKGKYFITSVQFQLSKIPNFKTEYGAIKEQLKANGITDPQQYSLKAISDAVIQIRKSKLPDPKQIGNSGSFFKNPIVDQKKYEQLKEKHNALPAYELEDHQFKIAAGWLIEQAGWKGFREKDYGVHEKQALVLVNYGKASGKEIYSLSERIINSVKSIFGIELEREVNVI